ncbi:MAG: FIST C-terminal domain-containing protein [Bacteroidetes bacterium]|nr:FIST C-terminal domain-containing protein [Bacteroidota bacterium]MCW5895556.1 FIST C-terminal domain-containing protein [Bacteroidota bacterium]
MKSQHFDNDLELPTAPKDETCSINRFNTNTIMKAKSIKGNSPEEIRSALQHGMADGFRPTLAIVFISVKQNRKVVRELLTRQGIDVFGATSCGEFTDGYQGEESIAMLLLDVSKDNYAVLFQDIGGRSIAEAARQLAEQAARQFKNPSLLLCSTGMNAKGEFFDGPTLVQTVREALGQDRFFVGGMAGDDMTFTGSYVFTNDRETDFGVAAIVLDADNVSIQGIAITGWKPMGISRTVTKSKGNLVYTIDNNQAIEMYLQYLGRKEDAGATSFDLMNDVSMYYPFIVERPGGGTFLHTPLRIDENENALHLDVAMPEGTKFWFSMPPDFDIVEEVLQEATRIKGENAADALLVFSCAGRINVLGPLVNAENEGLHKVWNAPMAGFFTYGEFGRDNQNNQEFHSGACSWVALKERT